jgi:hypothetical protein
LLQTERLEIEEYEPAFVERVIKSSNISALCPCYVVKWFTLSQEASYRILRSMASQDWLRRISLRALLEPNTDAPLFLKESDPEEQAMVFVRPSLAEDPNALLGHPDLAERLGLLQLMRRLWDRYQIGPPLRSQPDSEQCRAQLDRAFKCLNVIGLIGPRMSRTVYSHSSILMLMHRALGDLGYNALESYIRDPETFLGSTLANSYGLAPDAKERAHLLEQVKQKLAVTRVGIW